jgi:hypothetical protein
MESIQIVDTSTAETGLEPVVDLELLVEPPRLWLLPTPTQLDRGLFDRALRAASLTWQPSGFALAAPTAEPGLEMALPEVLEAWRATERELAGMTGDSPAQELLEANAMILQAMYQRLYRERMRR